ncbi:MAG TPA: hypothetical protein VE862_09335 [Candidatus Acidoferrum sp.]|nr:hypothetical protein [Candidatus Acidoferrum sp.]
MGRTRKKFDDDLKVKLYRALSSDPLRFDAWLAKSGVNRFTFNEYRTNGLKEKEVERVDRKYQLTAQGRNELERIENNIRIQSQRKYYNALLNSLNELTAPTELWTLQAQVSHFELPLPASVDVSMYGSEELSPLFDWAENHLRKHDGVGSKRLKGEFLKQTKHLVEPFLWMHIWERLTYLLGWHGRYGVKLTKETPPPLTIENILGFDLSFRMDYKGKELLKQTNLPEVYKIGKRLVGTILLRLAYREEADSEYSSDDLIPLLVKSHLLDRNDAQRIRRVIPKRVVKRHGHKGLDSTISFPGKSRWKERTEVILPIAFRYLREGGILEVRTGSTPEGLAKHFLEFRTTNSSK